MSVPDRLTLGVTDFFRTVAPHTPHHTQTGSDRPRKYSGPRMKIGSGILVPKYD